MAAGLGCAADYVASIGTLIYAPSDGKIDRQYTGVQGGKWLWFTDKDGNSIQFAHLSEYVGGLRAVSKGELIGKTGNTGTLTTGPHLHVQILKGTTRLDPEKYQWDTNGMSYEQAESFRVWLVSNLKAYRGKDEFPTFTFTTNDDNVIRNVLGVDPAKITDLPFEADPQLLTNRILNSEADKLKSQVDRIKSIVEE